MADRKNIVIVGGGYAGLNLIPKIEKFLPSTHRIVLIEEQEFFYQRLAALRASTSEDIGERVVVPYDKLFASESIGIVVKATVTAIKPHSVVLSTTHKKFGSEVPFEFLVRVIDMQLTIGYCRRKSLERTSCTWYIVKERGSRDICGTTCKGRQGKGRCHRRCWARGTR